MHCSVRNLTGKERRRSVPHRRQMEHPFHAPHDRGVVSGRELTSSCCKLTGRRGRSGYAGHVGRKVLVMFLVAQNCSVGEHSFGQKLAACSLLRPSELLPMVHGRTGTGESKSGRAGLVALRRSETCSLRHLRSRWGRGTRHARPMQAATALCEERGGAAGGKAQRVEQMGSHAAGWSCTAGGRAVGGGS